MRGAQVLGAQGASWKERCGAQTIACISQSSKRPIGVENAPKKAFEEPYIVPFAPRRKPRTGSLRETAALKSSRNDVIRKERYSEAQSLSLKRRLKHPSRAP